MEEIVLQDSIPSDSLAAAPGLDYGIVLEKPSAPLVAPQPPVSNGESWLISGLLLLFVAVCIRYRKNSRFFSLMLRDAMEVRERHNAFDDTLRETSFLWLLNLLWCACAGVILFVFLCRPGSVMTLASEEMRRLGVCMAAAVAFTLFLTLAYAVAGNVFADASKASFWIKGYLSLQALESIPLFPAALLALTVPRMAPAVCIFAAFVFILAKFLFIYKSFCIFFSRFAAWVLFLYYLCSLEIVPVVLTYVATRYLCYG